MTQTTTKILQGDCITVMRDMADDSVDCVVTSPPYWGLRDYGVDGQMGLEPTLGQHIEQMVAVFEEVRRVLKPTGTLWLNYGDCYATSPNGRSAADTKDLSSDDRTFRDKPFSTVGPVYGAAPGDPTKAANGTGRFGGGNAPAGPILGLSEADKNRKGKGGKDHHDQSGHGMRVVAGGYLKPKDLCMIPNRLAIALQDAGWWVRSEIIWGKPNAMPDSSGVQRPATSHEKIFLLTKTGDGDLWRARDTGALSFTPDLSQRCPLITDPSRSGHRWSRIGSYYDAEAVRVGRADSAGTDAKVSGLATEGAHAAIAHNRADKQRGHSRRHAGFNDRWDNMSKAEQQSNGRLLRNYEPDLSPIVPVEVWNLATAAFKEAHFATFPPTLAATCIMAGCPNGGVVLDPFGGAGTVGLVAEQLGRSSILIDLNADYCRMAMDRIRSNLGQVEARSLKGVGHTADAGPLFAGEGV